MEEKVKNNKYEQKSSTSTNKKNSRKAFKVLRLILLAIFLAFIFTSILLGDVPDGSLGEIVVLPILALLFVGFLFALIWLKFAFKTTDKTIKHVTKMEALDNKASKGDKLVLFWLINFAVLAIVLKINSTFFSSSEFYLNSFFIGLFVLLPAVGILIAKQTGAKKNKSTDKELENETKKRVDFIGENKDN